ncbi:MAG: hypothetical protein AB7U20_03260 [Planctomycetaceae bacterium]
MLQTPTRFVAISFAALLIVGMGASTPTNSEEPGSFAVETAQPFKPFDGGFPLSEGVRQDPAAGGIVGSIDPAKKRYLELLQKSVQRMSRDELLQATEALESQLDEEDRKADAALHSISESLEQLANEFPGTSAAGKARAALKTIMNQNGNPVAGDVLFQQLQPQPTLELTAPTY